MVSLWNKYIFTKNCCPEHHVFDFFTPRIQNTVYELFVREIKFIYESISQEIATFCIQTGDKRWEHNQNSNKLKWIRKAENKNDVE